MGVADTIHSERLWRPVAAGPRTKICVPGIREACCNAASAAVRTAGLASIEPYSCAVSCVSSCCIAQGAGA